MTIERLAILELHQHGMTLGRIQQAKRQLEYATSAPVMPMSFELCNLPSGISRRLTIAPKNPGQGDQKEQCLQRVS